MSQNRDVLELWRRLRQESLFVSAERESLGKLHGDLKEDHYKLLQQLYRTRRFQSNHYAAESGANLAECFVTDNRLQNCKFSEMSYSEADMMAPFLKALKMNPTLVAACLVYGEKMQLETGPGFTNLLETVVLSLYGQSCATQNHSALLEFIQCLMLHQIGATNRPRDVLKRGAFITTYRLLVEALPESRLFLTAALYQPIVQVLLDEGPPLEINAEKVCDYFSPRELQVRFGVRGSDQFKQKVAEFCKNTQQRLDDHVKRFSHAIEYSLACFPSAIAYVIGRAHSIVSDGGMCPQDEARTLAADLLLQDFICLAIVNPERYGVTGDLPITETARINLIQIAQRLQKAVISPVRHSGGFLTRMVEEILTLDSGDSGQQNTVSFEDRTVLCTRLELERLIKFLRQIEASEVQGVDRNSLGTLNRLVKDFKITSAPMTPESPTPKSPPPKFLEKTSNFIDKMDKKVKQLQQDGIKGLDKLRLDDDPVVEKEEENVFLIPLPGAEEEFKILSENDVVNQDDIDLDDRGSLDDEDDGDDGVSRGSKSNYSVEDDRTSSSSVSDHLSSLHGSAGAPIEVDRLQDETDSIAESNPHTNRDETLQALDMKMPTSRESIEDRMRKFELGVRFDIQNDRTDARSDCWSTDVAASEHSEPLTEAEYASRLEEIAEDPSEELRVPPEDSRSDIWSVECLVPSDNEDEEGPHSPPAEDVVRSRASTPGLSYGSVSSAFSDSNLKAEAGDYINENINDYRSDDGRGANRSPRPSVLQKTEAWKAQQQILSQTTDSTSRVSPTDNNEEQKPTKIGGRRAFTIKGLRKTSNVMKPKATIPQKLLPSALRKNLPSTPPLANTSTPPGNQSGDPSFSAFDVMAKYQQLSKKEDTPTGSLIDIEPTTPTTPIEKREEKTKKESIDEKQDRLEDVRRKLRYVLSAADPVDASPMVQTTRTTSQHEKLLELLRAQAYEALAIQDRNTAAQLHETVRSVEQLSQKQTKQVLDILWKEYNRRSDYVRYLVRARQKLLGALAHIRRVTRAGERAQETGRRHFLSVAASILLKKKSDSVQAFVQHYNRQQTMDDKAVLVLKLLQFLFGQIQNEPEWKQTNHSELEQIQSAVHSALLTRHNIYHLILYPNREVDIERDRVFSNHIDQISARITTSHPKLQIPMRYCRESPWPSAQEEARLISVYRTPQEKMIQTTRLCKAILNLLKLSNPQNIPGADDLVPVLVYVIIKANPPSLLSMIQYVETYVQTGSGEDSFYWMQFTAACKFIQTIEA